MTVRTMAIIGGGQSGLAAARAARDDGWAPVVLEAAERPAGSWPEYYDSLTLFSPARFSGFPGHPFPGDPDHYPARDEVVDFLEGYADRLGVEVRAGTLVHSVERAGDRYVVRTSDGPDVEADAVVAASGSFGAPHTPVLPGRRRFPGELRHVADYRSPEGYAGRRVVVVGGGNSAVQVAHELSEHARVTLAVRSPLQFVPQARGGRDTHYWLDKLKLDLLPPAVLSKLFRHTLVFDTGGYEQAVTSGRMPQRPMFAGFEDDGVMWADGTVEPVDVVLFATGYRPNLPYLADLGALSSTGAPRHDKGLSTTHRGLGYLGLEFQRSFSSNTLRGVHRDAAFVVSRLAARAGGRGARGGSRSRGAGAAGPAWSR